jgi:hypothetical protein
VGQLSLASYPMYNTPMRHLFALAHRYALALLLIALPLAALIGSTGITLPREVRAAQLVRDLVIGQSAQGRQITAIRVGEGPHKLVVVGNTHGGPEANTYALTTALSEHFRANPQEVPPEVSLYFIPTINPDGLALGWRFDAAGVDLNRNMNTNLDACAENDWSVTVQGARGLVSDTGGPYADSQVESRLVRSFLLDAAGAIFLHSNAGLVFPAYCDHEPSIAMGQAYAEGAGYAYSRYWPLYMITGGMHDWAGSLGIAAITPELVTGDLPEFEENLQGLRAVLARWNELLPLPEDRIEKGIIVPGVIWRYWRAYGGEAIFGVPLEGAVPTAEGYLQRFSKAMLELRPSQANTAYLVQPRPLGAEAAAAQSHGGGLAFLPVDGANAERYFPETGHSLKEVFLRYWERNGGLAVFGLPLSEEFNGRAIDGQTRVLQYFERAVLAYYPEDGSVRPEPLGAWALQRDLVRAGWAVNQVR